MFPWGEQKKITGAWHPAGQTAKQNNEQMSVYGSCSFTDQAVLMEIMESVEEIELAWT